jgi:hypothetical protein
MFRSHKPIAESTTRAVELLAQLRDIDPSNPSHSFQSILAALLAAMTALQNGEITEHEFAAITKDADRVNAEIRTRRADANKPA